MMRRQLVYAQFCVASGFSIAYPLHFADAPNTYGITNNTVIWPSFKKKLSNLFFQYHTKHTEKQTGYLALFQYRSCFCRPSPTINPKSSALDSQLMPSAVSAPVEGLRPFQNNPGDSKLIEDFDELRVAYCDSEGRVDETEDAFVKRELTFFLPVLIWEYLSIKKDIIKEDYEIHRARTDLRESEIDLQVFEKGEDNVILPPEIPPPESQSRFLIGTAVDTRAERLWEDYLSQHRSIPETVRKRKHADVDEQIEETVPARAPSATMSGTFKPHSVLWRSLDKFLCLVAPEHPPLRYEEGDSSRIRAED